MRTLLKLCTFSLILIGGARADKLLDLPHQIVFTSGTVLHDVVPLKWENDRVVVKHRGGVGPAFYRYIKSPDRVTLNRWRSQTEAAITASTAASVIKHRLSGQVFVTTRGAGAYKFSGAMIRVYPAELEAEIQARFQSKLPANLDFYRGNELPRMAAAAWDKTLNEYLGRELVHTSTDAEGKYEVEIPANQALLVICRTSRAVGYSHEYNTWVIKLEPGETRLDLNNRNQLR